MICGVGWFLYLEALLVFSVQYFKAASWLNDRCHLRAQKKHDNIANFLMIIVTIFNAVSCEFFTGLDEKDDDSSKG